MIRHALKNLWSRRAANVWLAIELVVLTILAWVILDPVIVKLYDSSRPVGYPSQQLAYFTIKQYDKEWRFYDPQLDDSAHYFQVVRNIQTLLQERPEIESVAFTDYSNQLGTKWFSYNRYFQNGDSIYAPSAYYIQGEGFFKTAGIQVLYPKGMTADELDNLPVNWFDRVITESMAKRLLGQSDVVGRDLRQPHNEDSHYPSPHVVAVIKDIRLHPTRNTTIAVFEPLYLGFDIMMNGYLRLWQRKCRLLVRFKDEVNPDDFIQANHHWIYNELRGGNLYVEEAKSLNRIAAEINVDMGVTNEARIGILLTVFFLLNAVLGVIGTLYLQTRRRQREAGVMKSFGASTRRLATTLVIESVILTCVTWLIGCMQKYLQVLPHPRHRNPRPPGHQPHGQPRRISLHYGSLGLRQIHPLEHHGLARQPLVGHR